jgi:ABC-type branched-subunit amino acid transport system ATPase component
MKKPQPALWRAKKLELAAPGTDPSFLLLDEPAAGMNPHEPGSHGLHQTHS